MVTKVYLVRHCQSMGNIGGRFQGRYDADITPEGAQQLELLGLRFRNETIDGVYASPLLRAKRTGEAIAKYHQMEVIEEPGFLEIDVGEMENLPFLEMVRRFPELTWNWDHSPELCVFPGGETMEEVYHRVNAALDRVIGENPGKTVVVATHGGVLRNIKARVDFGDISGIGNCEVFDNTSVSLLEWEDGALRWKFTNDTSHLPPEMRKPAVSYRFDHLEGAGPV